MGAGVKATVLGGGGLALLIATVMLGTAAPQQANGCTAAADPDAIDESTEIAGFKGDQLTNAALIMDAGAALDLDAHGQTIGVMTAIGESSLKNLTHGDKAGPDSLGLFQQRDNWGSRADRLDPTKAATMFFEKLLTVDGWEDLDPSEAAHRVQGNADPDHYTKSWPAAEEIVAGLSSGSCAGGNTVYPLDEGYNMTSDYGARNTGVPGASTWHPAIDLAGVCGDPVYAAQGGTVTKSNRLWLSITHPDGYVISYLHTYKWERLVSVDDEIEAGDQIAVIGNEGPSSGCHLDVRINVTGNTNPEVAKLVTSESIGGPNGYVNPERFFELFDLEICPSDWCARTY